MKRIFIYTIILVSFGCTGINDNKNQKLNIDERVNILLNQMTLDERVAQLYTFINGQNGLDDPELYASDSSRIFYRSGNGSFFLGFGCNDAKLFAESVNKIQSHFLEKTRLGIPVIILGEGLQKFVANGSTSFPQYIAMGGTIDLELIEKIYWVIASEKRAWGFHKVYCPNLDLGRDQRFGCIEETYGKDLNLTSQIGLAAVNGLQGRDLNDLSKQRVVSTLKHFAVLGEQLGGTNCTSVGKINTIYFHENPLLSFEVAIPELSNMKITMEDTAILKDNIKNTRSVAGTEVVQLYIRDEICSVTRTVNQLKDLKRVSINPGESKTMEFAIDNSKLSFFIQELKRKLNQAFLIRKLVAIQETFNQLILL